VAINKGTAVIELAQAYGVRVADSGAGAVLYAGDDQTDEDAFVQLRQRWPESVTVRVGEMGAEADRTAAEFIVADPSEMRRLLEWLAAMR
jgi:trehalose-phosphatase